jgi:Family of unknown function (DUF6510)
MDALDGNAIAGHLLELFGADLTTASGTCASCGATGPIAELSVYVSAGTVARCRSCEAVVIVLATLRGVTRVDLRGMAALDIAGRNEATS